MIHATNSNGKLYTVVTICVGKITILVMMMVITATNKRRKRKWPYQKQQKIIIIIRKNVDVQALVVVDEEQ